MNNVKLFFYKGYIQNIEKKIFLREKERDMDFYH
jgi:hypothetical protein